MDEQYQQQQQKTNTIRLSQRENYQLKRSYRTDLFDFHTDQTQVQTEQAHQTIQQNLRQLNSDETVTYKDKRRVENNEFNALRARLFKDKWSWCFFSGKDSPEMVRVKKTLNLVTNLISQSLSVYVKQAQGDLDIAALRNDLNTALQECIDACDNYFRKKKEQGGGKTSAGKRRLDLVTEVQKHCRAEKRKFDALIDSLKQKSGMESNNLEEIKNNTLQELTTQHLTLEAKDDNAVWQNEGNSTDVYKITANDGEGDKTYYIKENLPLISEDISGFLDRRSSQLDTSFQYKQSEREKEKEERRLSDAKLSEVEYRLAQDFIRVLKTRIDSASAADRTAVGETVTSLLAHDFDKMFQDLDTHNRAAEYADEKNMNWEEIAQNANHKLQGVALYILGYRRKNQGGGEAAGAAVPLKKMTAQEWVKEKLGLDANKDRDILALFKEKKGEAIKRLFCISLGKEVELFGQIRERQGSEAKEIAASNNTATYQLATKMRFTDVITTSDTRVVKFKDRTGRVVEHFCTVMEEAKGEEFVELIKKAEKEEKKIHYTPDAIQQLMRLQAFDIVCNQTDRHGRNFKCEYEEGQDGSLIIKKIKSYDHDNSFGEGNIQKLIDGEKNGFLPGMNKILKKGSAEYRYVNKKYFGIKSPGWMDQATRPKLRFFSDSKSARGIVHWSDLSGNTLKNFNPSVSMKRLLFEFGYASTQSFLTEEKDGDKNWYGPIFKRDKTKEDKNYPKDENKIDSEEYEKVSKELGGIYNSLRGILDPGKHGTSQQNIANGFRTDLTPEEKQDIFGFMEKLHDLNEKYDFTGLAPKDFNAYTTTSQLTGFMDYWIQYMLYTFGNLFRGDPDLADIAAETTEKQYTKEEEDERKKAMERLKNKEGDLVIPSLLHFDMESYLQIQKIANEEDPKMEADLKLLNFSDAKINGIKQRCKDTLKFLENAKAKAEAFYLLAGWNKKPQNQFFLEKADYDKIEDLSQLSVDPGNTYLSVDNEHYLFGQEEFTWYAKEEDEGKALQEEIQKRKDKRWHDENYGDGEKAKKKFYGNPLQSKIVKMPENLQPAG